MGSNTAHAQGGACECSDGGMAVECPTPRTPQQRLAEALGGQSLSAHSLPERGHLPVLDVQGWYDKQYRRSRSSNTIESATKSIEAFERFALERYPNFRGHHLEYPYTDGVLAALRQKELDAYKILDTFAGYLGRETITLADGMEAHLKPHTTANRVYGAVSLLRYHDIQVLKETFKEKVTLPKPTEIEDKPVRAENLRLLYNWAGPVLRTLMLVLTSSGMRIGEAAALRVKDIDFEMAKPIALVHIRGSTTKTDTARDVFISDEAVQTVKMLIYLRNKQPEDFLFFPGKVCSTKRLRKYYHKLLQKVGKQYPEVLERVEEHSYYNLHLHNLGRKWFFSKTVGVVGETTAHALMGHSFYLKTYYRRLPEERVADYLHAMPALSFFKGRTAGSDKHYDVKAVRKDDETRVLSLLEQGYAYAQDLNGKAVYKKEIL